MEFAVSAIFLLVLLLPGFILQSAYTKGFWRWNSSTAARSLTEQVPAAVVLASGLHTVWASLSNLIGYPVNLNSVVMLLLGSYGHNEAHFDATVTALTTNPYKVFFYFQTLYCASALLGYLCHWIVRERGWDRSTRILRFNNHWFYLYYHIEGDHFVLRYSEMTTINLDYIFVAPETEPDSELPGDHNSPIEVV